jgi:tRNA(Arg) A34 adenosine deaminase TadA
MQNPRVDTFRRRDLLSFVSSAVLFGVRGASAGEPDESGRFIAEAFRMRSEALAAGDQPYGAVLVKGGTIIGYGPSRVVIDSNVDAHAERVAIWEAQRRLGSTDLSGAVLYSTSMPCRICESAAAAANVERMIYGPGAADGGRPRR